MGIPEMADFWDGLCTRIETASANRDEIKIYKILHKTFSLIASNPRHPGLHTHEIEELSDKFGSKIYQSYCENRNPRALRVYWLYGPEKDTITIVAISAHPNESKSKAYKKLHLSKVQDQK